MVALGCAHEQGIGRSCACGGGIQRLDMASLCMNWLGTPIKIEGGTIKEWAVATRAGSIFFSSAAQTLPRLGVV